MKLLVFTVLIASLWGASAHATEPTCENLFKTGDAEVSLRPELLRGPDRVVESFRLQRIPTPVVLQPPHLDRPTLDQIFTGAQDLPGGYGRIAIMYMGHLSLTVPSAVKAEIWIELVDYIVKVKKLFFVSEMFKIEGERYLFRGANGETLFIDGDGAVYRTYTEHSLREVWEFERLGLRRISPMAE